MTATWLEEAVAALLSAWMLDHFANQVGHCSVCWHTVLQNDWKETDGQPACVLWDCPKQKRVTRDKITMNEWCPGWLFRIFSAQLFHHFEGDKADRWLCRKVKLMTKPQKQFCSGMLDGVENTCGRSVNCTRRIECKELEGREALGCAWTHGLLRHEVWESRSMSGRLSTSIAFSCTFTSELVQRLLKRWVLLCHALRQTFYLDCSPGIKRCLSLWDIFLPLWQ